MKIRNDPDNGGRTWRKRVLEGLTTRNPTADRVELDGQLKFQLRPNINECYTKARS
jgi:hypothetical protein